MTRLRAHEARAFKGDSSALCLFAHFLQGDYARNDGKRDAATLAGLDRHLEASPASVKRHGASFVDPALVEVVLREVP
jgi:hypothetical protein